MSLVDENLGIDPFELIADKLSLPADKIVYRKICIELLKELFKTLSRKDKVILGKSFGIFGYPKTKLKDIALEQLMKPDGVIKARRKAIEKLRKTMKAASFGYGNRPIGWL